MKTKEQPENQTPKRVSAVRRCVGITIFDPINMVLEATKKAGYKPKCHIQYSPHIRRWFKLFGAWGLTFWPDDNSGVIIEISTHLKVKHVPEILAHELSHAIAGHDAGHGKQWRNVFDNIHKHYCELINHADI